MTGLADFLLARIADDEKVALESQQATRDEARRAGQPDPDLGALQSDLEVDSEHGFVGVDPARVIAECKAKRRIVEQYVDFLSVPGERGEQRETLRWTCELLALPYADHPDYRQEWRP